MDEEEEKEPKARWVLHPRRGHAALNSGLKSLNTRPLTVVGRPDDLLRGTEGEVIGTGELGESAKKDLETGLREMAGEGGGGIACVPVWLDDKVHASLSCLLPLFFRAVTNEHS